MTEAGSGFKKAKAKKGINSPEFYFYGKDGMASLFKRLFFFFVIILLFPGAVNAQVGMQISYWAVFDGNVFRNYENLPDIVHQPNLSLFYNRMSDKGRFRIFYEGSFAHFNEFTTRQFHQHHAGLNGSNLLGDSGPVLSWGLRGGKRFNRSDYEYYDYRYGSAYINLRFDGAGNRIWVLGATSKVQDYEKLPLFSFWEHRLFLRSSFFFRTKTTLISTIQAGYKHYWESVINEELIEETIETAGNGNGPGNGNQHGRRDSTSTHVVQVESSGGSIFQWSAVMRLAQSLGSSTGLAIQGRIQRNPKGGGRVLTGQDSGYESEDVLYDDPYNYNSDEIFTEWTQRLPWQLMLKAGGEIQWKRYDHNVSDTEFAPVLNVLRSDKRIAWWATLQKIFPMKAFLGSVTVYISYTSIQNDSNEPYFQYTNRMTNLGLKIG